MHGAVADHEGNVALSEPLLEGVWGAWAARTRVVATVERVVDRLEGLGHRVGSPPTVSWPWWRPPSGPIPAASPPRPPGELVRRGHRLLGRGPATRRDFDAWARHWVLDATTHGEYLERVGSERLTWLAGRTDPESWRQDADAHPVDADLPPPLGGRLPVFGAREVEAVAARSGPTPCWPVPAWPTWPPGWRWTGPGPGVVAPAHGRAGTVGLSPTPADPYIFNHRVFPGTSLLADASTVLGMVVGGPGTVTVACLGAAQVDRTQPQVHLIPGGPFLVGSGGANDVASRAAGCVVVSLARPQRLRGARRLRHEPGERVCSVVTDLGVLRRLDGVLRVAAVPAGDAPLPDRVRALVGGVRLGTWKWPPRWRSWRRWPRRGARPAALRPRAALPRLIATFPPPDPRLPGSANACPRV